MTQKKVILCIDDEPAILQSLKTELKSIFGKDFLIEVAEDGMEALELVNELINEDYRIFLVISDYVMPQMKGDKVLETIHQITPDSIKIMLTGQGSIEGIANAVKNAKLYRYIAKPWQAEDFKMTVKEAIKIYIRNEQLKLKNKHLEDLSLEQAELIEQLHEKERSLQESLDAELKIKEVASHFLPNQFISLLGYKSITDINLGDAIQKEMTVLFSDIRGFTALSEKMLPAENFKFINSYLKHMEPFITKNNGFIDKFIGDAIMALFNNEADDAVKAAIAMLKHLVDYNEQRAKKGYQAVKVGIGVNTGSLILGTIGGNDRMECTVISDAVNVSSRTESLTKKYDVSLLITHHTFLKLIRTSDYSIRKIDNVTVKGKEQETIVYEVFDADPYKVKMAKLETLDLFNQAVIFFYQEDFVSAQQLFEKCLAACPQDTVSQKYLSRISLVTSTTISSTTE